MRTLAAKYPADDDIAVLYAESLILAEPPQIGHAHQLVNETALTVVEDVLKRNPRHLGANHRQFADAWKNAEASLSLEGM
jgi:hypothetical protein